MDTKYNPEKIELKWYDYWMKNKFFHSRPNHKKPYTILIPPPNVTGILHMGHMLNNTIQDVLVRRARLLGFNACWVPGTDHASIATEAKVMKKLKDEGVHVGPLHDHRDGTASFYLKDPEGNWLEMLFQPPNGIPSNNDQGKN